MTYDSDNMNNQPDDNDSRPAEPRREESGAPAERVQERQKNPNKPREIFGWALPKFRSSKKPAPKPNETRQPNEERRPAAQIGEREPRDAQKSQGVRRPAAQQREKAVNNPQSNDSRKQPPQKSEQDDEFKINFDFDGKYKDVPDSRRPIRQRRERRSGCLGGIMYAAFVICISLLLASLAWMAAVDVLGFGSVDEQVHVVVPEDFTLDFITDMLHENGLIRYRFLFRWYANFSGAMDKIVPGEYYLNTSFDYRALVQGMTARAGARVEVTVTIPEGFTLDQIFELLEERGVARADELWDAATNHPYRHGFLSNDTVGDRLRLEGFLFPNTYNFFINTPPIQAINRMLNEFNRRFTEEYRERAEDMGMTIHEIINIAAMIEREAANDAERRYVSSVIHNRLNNPSTFPYLQIDATIFYALNALGAELPPGARITELDHTFNTYMHRGLPPGPIANPGIASIRAALFPAETNYYFYALHVDGHHEFFRNYAQHRAFVQSANFAGTG